MSGGNLAVVVALVTAVIALAQTSSVSTAWSAARPLLRRIAQSGAWSPSLCLQASFEWSQPAFGPAHATSTPRASLAACGARRTRFSRARQGLGMEKAADGHSDLSGGR